MDLKIVEQGNGGDLLVSGKDLAMYQGFENMIYLALFGGNVEQDTPQTRNEAEQAFDFWGNTVFFNNDSSLQFNSQTERMLQSVALSSSGRLQIEQAVKKDLEFMQAFAKVSVSVTIPDRTESRTDTLRINIGVLEPDNLTEKKYVYIWDGMKIDIETGDLTPEYILDPGIDEMIIEYSFIVR